MHAIDFLIVGLGNPGHTYENTRHNAGRIALAHVRESLNATEWNTTSDTHALFARATVADKDIELFFPGSFMNESGGPVAFAQKRHALTPDQIVVLYDDIDLPIGSFKISFDRGAGGHNGIASVEKKLGTKTFVRIRIGIAPMKLFGGMRAVSGAERKRYVLGGFTRGERKKLDGIAEDIAQAVKAVVTEGHEKAMNTYN